jgi:PEP-CTERM motif-containing protein
MFRASLAGIVAVLVLSQVNPAYAANLVTNPGFESQVSTLGSWPSGYGYWQGDYSAIVTTENGVAPQGGSQMLNFIYSASAQPDDHTASELIQLIDISAYHDLILTGQATATGSVYFNRVLGDSQTDTQFAVRLLAMSGVPADFPVPDYGLWVLTFSESSIESDGNPATWEQASVQLQLPANTDYLAILIWARENVFNDTTGVEFDGHYADSASVEIIPEPATMSLLAVGLGAVFMRKRRKG